MPKKTLHASITAAITTATKATTMKVKATAKCATTKVNIVVNTAKAITVTDVPNAQHPIAPGK